MSSLPRSASRASQCRPQLQGVLARQFADRLVGIGLETLGLDEVGVGFLKFLVRSGHRFEFRVLAGKRGETLAIRRHLGVGE